MRAPKRRKPLIRRLAEWQPNERAQLAGLAKKVRYIGSPEHKDTPFFAGPPRPRADASICPRELAEDREKIEGWLRKAMELGTVGELREGEFPRYVWFKEGDTVYEGRLSNRELGEYKGYPLEPDEWPSGIEQIYEPFSR